MAPENLDHQRAAHSATSRRSGGMTRIARLALGGMAALLGISASAVAAAEAPRSVAPEHAPASWIAYAQKVSEVIHGSLMSDEAAAVRFKVYLDATRSDSAQVPPPLKLSLWIDAKGVITRAEFAPFAHEEANADLTSLLVGRAMSSAPPKGMLLPLRLSVQLASTPAGEKGDVLRTDPPA